MMDSYNLRIRDGSKFFLFGPSNCGKTFYVVDFLLNIENFTENYPRSIIFVYTIWQKKYDEIMSLVDYFIEDSDQLENQINERCKGQPTLIIFDDMIGSDRLKFVAKFFTVNGRHLSITMMFLSQRLFINNEYFRQISQNCDYFIIFRNPRNQRDILELAKQITPGSLELLDIYKSATEKPWSYLCINLTQQCPQEIKYTSHHFDYDHKMIAYVLNKKST